MLELLVGPDYDLEAEADEILAADRKTYRDATKGLRGADQTVVYGILTDEQLQLRAHHEVLAIRGTVDGAHMSGLFRRAWNPLANTRPTCRRRFSLDQDPWRQDYYEFSDDDVAGTWLPTVTRDVVLDGQHYIPWFTRDPAWPRFGDARDVGNLNLLQRTRIRAALRRVPRHRPELYWLLRDVLAAQYEVPSWIISRIVGPRE